MRIGQTREDQTGIGSVLWHSRRRAVSVLQLAVIGTTQDNDSVSKAQNNRRQLENVGRLGDICFINCKPAQLYVGKKPGTRFLQESQNV